MGGRYRLAFVVGDRLLVVMRRRCSELGGRLCHLPYGLRWGVPSCLSLVDVSRRLEDTEVCRDAG